MKEVVLALISCLPLLITATMIIIVTWKNRGRIESIDVGSIKIRFNNSNRVR